MNYKYIKAGVALVTIIVLGLLAGTLSERPRAPVVISHGEADVGGAFTLVDTAGNTVTDQTLLGRASLIYFGYTNCPDVCPLDMNRISMALELLAEDLDIDETLQPVFISIDPARDTPEVVAAFLENYHPAFIGLTGTSAQMEVAAAAYKVAHKEILDSENQPLINHTSHIYLMDRSGKYLTHFGPDLPPAALAEALGVYLEDPS